MAAGQQVRAGRVVLALAQLVGELEGEVQKAAADGMDPGLEAGPQVGRPPSCFRQWSCSRPVLAAEHNRSCCKPGIAGLLCVVLLAFTEGPSARRSQAAPSPSGVTPGLCQRSNRPPLPPDTIIGGYRGGLRAARRAALGVWSYPAADNEASG